MVLSSKYLGLIRGQLGVLGTRQGFRVEGFRGLFKLWGLGVQGLGVEGSIY